MLTPATVIKKVQVELEALGLVAAEYRITEIIGDTFSCTFDHENKTVRVGTLARAPGISFMAPVKKVPDFLKPARMAVPNFL